MRLSDIRVVDLTQHLSGPYCTWILASLGAEVVKVEPLAGEAARESPPFRAGRSIYVASVNRGKRSLALDLKTAKGREVLHRLVARSDVLVENFRPKVRDRLGLSDAEIAAINPRLVRASINGFGPQPAFADRPAFDIIVQAMSGIMSLNGPLDGPPCRVGVSIGDMAASLFAVIGILARLLERDGGQPARPVEVSMLACQVALMENAVARYLNAGEIPKAIGTRHPVIAPFEAFPTADRPIVVATGREADWSVFCCAVGLERLIDDPRFRSLQGRLDNRDAMEREIAERFRTAPSAEWLSRLEAVDIPCGPINSVPDALASGLYEALGTLSTVPYPDGDWRFAANPLRDAGRPEAPDPVVGEHSRATLGELGYGPSEIEAMARQGIVGLAISETTKPPA